MFFTSRKGLYVLRTYFVPGHQMVVISNTSQTKIYIFFEVILLATRTLELPSPSPPQTDNDGPNLNPPPPLLLAPLSFERSLLLKISFFIFDP